MSCVYKISTLDKKSICQEEIFHKIIDGETYAVTMEQWWRWGYVVITDVDKDAIDPENPNGLLVTDYSIDDQDLNDGVSLWFNFTDNVPEEERDLFEQAWEEDGYSGVEDLGWNHWDTEMTFVGPLEVELLEEIEDTPESDCDSERDPSKPVWPFS